MFILDLFVWWYGSGWKGVLTSTGRRLDGLTQMFSIRILLQTLFAPWRRIITQPGASLDAHVRAFFDNLVSRVVGFTVRIFVLFAAGVAVAFLAIIGLLELVGWPLVPLLGIGLLVWGVL